MRLRSASFASSGDNWEEVSTASTLHSPPRSGPSSFFPSKFSGQPWPSSVSAAHHRRWTSRLMLGTLEKPGRQLLRKQSAAHLVVVVRDREHVALPLLLPSTLTWRRPFIVWINTLSLALLGRLVVDTRHGGWGGGRLPSALGESLGEAHHIGFVFVFRISSFPAPGLLRWLRKGGWC